MHALKGLAAVLLLGAVIGYGWLRYHSYLTKGLRPPESVQKLNELQLEGTPDFTLPDLTGQSVSFANFEGHWRLVNFWASWCVPCVKEFPSMLNLVEKLEGKLMVMAISNDHDEVELRSFLKSFPQAEARFVVLWDRDRLVSSLFGTQILPESYIIDPEGRIVRKVSGVEEWDNDYVIEYFKNLMTR